LLHPPPGRFPVSAASWSGSSIPISCPSRDSATRRRCPRGLSPMMRLKQREK